MKSHQWQVQHRRLERIALLGLRFFLALVLVAIGCRFFVAPQAAEDLRRAWRGPGLVLSILVATHLAGGIALLFPRLAQGAALLVGVSMTAVAVSLGGVGETLPTGGFVCIALALFLLGAGQWLRRRTEEAAWHEMLARYAGSPHPGSAGRLPGRS
jgi:hypothetical protein